MMKEQAADLTLQRLLGLLAGAGASGTAVKHKMSSSGQHALAQARKQRFGSQRSDVGQEDSVVHSGSTSWSSVTDPVS